MILEHMIVAKLRREGYRIFAPRQPPEIGSRWTPTRGTAEPRYVFDVDEGVVFYSTNIEGGCRAQSVSLPSWHTWRTRARARKG